jgi:hypothetical protein
MPTPTPPFAVVALPLNSSVAVGAARAAAVSSTSAAFARSRACGPAASPPRP